MKEREERCPQGRSMFITRRCIPFACAAILLAGITGGGTAHAQLRVVNYNIAQLLGDEDALMDVFAAMHADDKPGFAVPVSVLLFQEVRSTDVAVLHQLLNASAPPGVLYAQGTYTSAAGEDDAAGAQAMFYRAGMLLEDASEHADIPTGAGRRADRWHLRVLGYDSPLAGFYAYSGHLKADTGPANENLRLWGVQQIRNNAHALGADRHIIYAGDFNFYNNGEPGYQEWFVPLQNNPAIDPLGTGSWNGPSNAIKHTQSPRTISAGGLASGGMDDRFDFQLSTWRFHDGEGLAFIPGSYRAFGNDGLKYDTAINSGNNFYYPDDVPYSNFVADALHDASDHIPVIADYQLPARLAATVSPSSIGTVIQGAVVDIEWGVTNNVNPAHVVTPLGADVLAFTATGSELIAGLESGFVAALDLSASGKFTFDTAGATTGPVEGVITFTSENEAVQPSQVVRSVGGTVLAPSQPSFEPDEVIDTATLRIDLEPDTGQHIIEVLVYNVGYDALQALLNVDDVTGAAPPLSFVTGPMFDIGAEPATLTFVFNTDRAAIGVHEFALTFHVSDEDLPGATSSELDLTVFIGLGESDACPADLNGDAQVGVADLLALLAAWGECEPPTDECAADLSGDGSVGVGDLLLLLAAWGGCPR